MKYFKEIIILGEPKAQKRHRHHLVQGKGKKGFISNYDPSSADKADFLSIVQQNAPEIPLSSPVAVQIKLFFTRPKSHFGTGKNCNRMKDSAPSFHTSKPDVDNIFKFYSDSMNKIFWKDDSLICASRVEKRYSDNPRTEITIVEL